MKYSRRTMLGAMGGLVAGSSLIALSNNAIATPADPKAERFTTLKHWSPHKLDPKECAPIAYAGYYHKGLACGFGTFYGIVGVMAEKFGEPYKNFPFLMLEANKGGIADWGTICGALYGAAAAFFCFYPRAEANPMVTELFRWYEKTAFPIYDPGENTPGVKGKLPTNVSNSVLCHISVSKWCKATKFAANSKERSERCGRITADVCTKAIEILNAKIDAGKDWKGALAKQESVKTCTTCHAKGKMSDMQKGNMDCTPCHSGSDPIKDKFHNHPQ